jgi:N-methylhydantoinase A
VLLGVDVGGTFTDAVLLTAHPAPEPDSGNRAALSEGARAFYTAKVPSTPADQSQGVMHAIREVLQSAGAQPAAVQRLAHGMTVATNALLEGRTARTALVATEGFTDIVELGRQARAELYRLCAPNPKPLAPPELRFGAPERTTPQGVLRELQPEQARALGARIAATRPPVQAVAVVLLHSYAHPQPERLLGELLAEQLPGVHISLSHELVGTFREYERAASTELDAALSPLLAGYLRRLNHTAREQGLCEPEIMQSSGGLTSSARAQAHAALTILSGPAGGVGGAQLLAQTAGEQNVVCFDMGGTSCDVCTIAQGSVAETSERTVAGRPLALPALDIHTVGAGGGSIAWRDAGGALRVGPRSAGAQPGPACYGAGGEQATVTDANVVLGRLPHDVPLAGGIVLDHAAAKRAVARLAEQLRLSVERCAEGIVAVAEAEMAGALRRMTVERGLDPRSWALMPFGGAGGLHAAALAAELGMHRVVFARASGVLSALGLAAAAPRRDAARTVMLCGEALTAAAIRGPRDDLIGRVGYTARIRIRYELRYRGQSFELGVEEECKSTNGEIDANVLREAFQRAHEQRYGYRDEGSEVELVTMRVSAWGEAPTLSLACATTAEPVRERRPVRFEASLCEAQCLRGELPPGTRVAGPAVCALPQATLWVPPGWSGEVDECGTVRLSR